MKKGLSIVLAAVMIAGSLTAFGRLRRWRQQRTGGRVQGKRRRRTVVFACGNHAKIDAEGGKGGFGLL